MLIYALIELFPKLMIFLYAVGLVLLFASPWDRTGRFRRTTGILLILLMVAVAFPTRMVNGDFLLNFLGMVGVWALIPIALLRGIGSAATQAKPPLARRLIWPAVLAASIGVVLLSYLPSVSSAALNRTEITEGDSVTLNLYPGAWPIFGEVGLYLADRSGIPGADYMSPDWSGNLIIDSTDLNIAPKRIDHTPYAPSGIYRFNVSISPTFWQRHLGKEHAVVPNTVTLTIRDTQGDIGKHAAAAVIRSAITDEFARQYLPVLGLYDWAVSDFVNQDGLWCLTYGGTGDLTGGGRGCIDPGGVDGSGNGFRKADVQKLDLITPSGPLAADIARVKASFRPAFAEWLSQNGLSASEWSLARFHPDPDPDAYDSSWVEYQPDGGDWKVALKANGPGGGGTDYRFVVYLLHPDGGVTFVDS